MPANEEHTLMASASSARRTFYAALVVGMLLLLARTHFGLEWFGDEANALAEPMRYAMGDLPIVDSWHTQFSSGLLLTPLVRLLLSAFDSGSGLVIGFRSAFVLMQGALAMVVQRVLRRVTSEWAASAVAITVFWYAPYYYVFPYYNNIAIVTLLVSALATYAAFSGEGGADRRLLVLAGLSFSVGVIVYPTMLGMLPFTVAGILAHTRLRNRPVTSVRSAVLLLLGIVFGTLLAYAVTVLLIASRGELLASLPHFLNPIDRDMSLGALVARFVRTKAVVGASVAALLAIAAGLTLARFSRLSREGAVVAAVWAGCLFAIAAPYLPHPLLYYMDIQQSAMLSIAVILPFLMLVRRDETVSGAFWLLTLPAIGASASTAFVSYEGFETATMPMVIGAVATLLVLFRSTHERQSDGQKRSVAIAPYLATAAVLVLLFGTTLSLTGGDAPTWRLDTTIGAGPYRSVRTTAAGAERYGRYMDLVVPLGRQGDRIAFVEEFPVGYLLAGSRPGTYSVWTTFSTGDLWQAYLDITGNYPDTIVSTRFAGPNGGRVASPFEPPFGLEEFATRYSETYRDNEFVVYQERVPKP